MNDTIIGGLAEETIFIAGESGFDSIKYGSATTPIIVDLERELAEALTLEQMSFTQSRVCQVGSTVTAVSTSLDVLTGVQVMTIFALRVQIDSMVGRADGYICLRLQRRAEICPTTTPSHLMLMTR